MRAPYRWELALYPQAAQPIDSALRLSSVRNRDHSSAQHLLFRILCELVDYPNDIRIDAVLTDSSTSFTVTVHSTDIAKVIGFQGRTAQSIRTVMSAIARKLGRSNVVIIAEGGVMRPNSRGRDSGPEVGGGLPNRNAFRTSDRVRER
jgi:predicted RNA-binding protein YlqC (UPF0109 family)